MGNAAIDANSTVLDVVEGYDLSATTAIITSGAAGLGLETARALAHAGSDIGLGVRLRSPEAAAPGVAELRRFCGNAISVSTIDLGNANGPMERLHG